MGSGTGTELRCLSGGVEVGLGFYHRSEVIKVVGRESWKQMGDLEVLGGQCLMFTKWWCGAWLEDTKKSCSVSQGRLGSSLRNANVGYLTSVQSFDQYLHCSALLTCHKCAQEDWDPVYNTKKLDGPHYLMMWQLLNILQSQSCDAIKCIKKYI